MFASKSQTGKIIIFNWFFIIWIICIFNISSAAMNYSQSFSPPVFKIIFLIYRFNWVSG